MIIIQNTFFHFPLKHLLKIEKQPTPLTIYFTYSHFFYFIYRVKVLECSAKDDINIKEIFRTFLTLSRIVPRDSDETTGLKRRSSAYVSASKGGRRAASPAPDKEKQPATSDSSNSLAKPRSRSLIRRSSRKTKQQIRDAHNGAEECTVS